MAQVTTTEGSSIKTVRYEYDSAGNRITAIVDDGSNVTRTEYLTDDHNPTGYSQVLQETTFDAGDNPTRKVVYAIGHDQVSQTVYARSGGSWGAGETAFFGTDGHGSVRVLYDLAAAVVTAAGVEQLFHFDAYGNLLGDTWTGAAQPVTSYLYSGESFDFNIGQQYLRARWYDAVTSRFNRLDPFFGNHHDPQSFHKYAYVHGDPIQGIDPTGKFNTASALSGIGIGLQVGALGGGLIGFMAGVLQAGDEGNIWNAFGTILHYTATGIVLGGLGGAAAGAAAGGLAVTSLLFSGSGLAVAGLLSFNNVTLDELLAALPYLPYMGTPNSWIKQLSPKIKEQAKKHDIAEELIASVLLYELHQYNALDTIGDREVFGGKHHSIGVAQLRVDNVRNWVPSMAGASDKDIRPMLIDPEQSVALLTEAMSYWNRTYTSGASRAQWERLTQDEKEKKALYFSSAKDVAWGGTEPSAWKYGVERGLRVVQRNGLLK